MSKSEKFWDKMAKGYDQEERNSEPTRIKIIEKTRKYLEASNIVLDYGCGTGLFCNEIADNVKVIYAIDISSKMIAIAKNNGEKRKIKNIEYLHSTIYDENSKRGSFDVILAFYILHLLEDIDKTMQRINELLKPGGLLISVTPCMGEKNRLITILFSFVIKIGLIPKIRPFLFSELEELTSNGNFEIMEAELLRPRSPEYFIVAKKK